MIWFNVFSISSISLKTTIPLKIGTVLFFIIGTIETMHWILVKGPITVVSILTIGATNLQESLEFLSIKSSFALFVILPYLFLFVYSISKKRRNEHHKYKNIIIGLVVFISIVFVSENVINGRLIRKGLPQIFKVYFSFSEQYGFYKQTEDNLKVKKLEVNQQTEEDNVFVLIIGESLNRNHMSLYGYHNTTSPKLTERNDLFVFKDVVSPYSNTINSVLSFLTESNLVNKKNPEHSIDLFDIFSSAGFETYWLSNQAPYGIWENRVTSLAKKSNNYQFVNLSSNSSMEATLTASFDSKLFSPLTHVLEFQANKKLIIIHLMGNHTSYKKRYPKHFSVYTGGSHKEQIIAEYDNSVLYNDYIVDSLFNLVQEYSSRTNTIASAIYLSDHGENVYDEKDEVGHTYSSILPKANVEIPFIVWLSDDYISKYPNIINDLQMHINKPYVADDLFHSIIDLNKLTTPYFEDYRSLFNLKLNTERPRILIDKQNYDEK